MFHDTTLGSVLAFYSGKSIRPGGKGRYPVYGSNGVIGASDAYRFDDGIIIGRVGAYCGSLAYCRGKFWASDNTIVAKPKVDRSSVQFFAYLLAAMDLNRHAGGAAQPLVTQATLKALPARVPAEACQHRIASILGAYDDLIQNNVRRISILQETARRTYEEWFVRFRFPGHENVRRVESGLGPVPQGWALRPLGEVANITMGLSPKGDTYNEVGLGTPLINGPVEFGENFTRRVKWTTSPTKLCRKGDLIVCVRGSTTGKHVKSDGEYCLGRGVCSIRSPCQSFVDQMFAHELPVLLAQTGGSTFPSWTGSQLKSHSTLLPPPHLLRRFEACVGPMSDAVFLYSRQNEVLRTTRDLLLRELLGAVPGGRCRRGPEQAGALLTSIFGIMATRAAE
jgi:type I restriction enzyme, S subunit